MSLKLHIPESDDWKTDTNNNTVNAFRELMIENNEYQDDPMVGIFWYDPEEDDLFGVYSIDAEDTNYFKSIIFNSEVRTCKPLHYAVWQKNCNKGKDKRFQTMEYIKYPRGIIFEIKNKGFAVCVGKWIKDYPQVKQLVINEFQLPENTEFIVDQHWDLGHGWSDKEL